MSLYNAILDYIRRTSQTALNAVEIEAVVAKYEVLLNNAYTLRDSKLEQHGLDLLVSELGRIDQQYLGRNTIDSGLLQAKKEQIRAEVGFFQQLIRQEGKADSYEQAIRRQFTDEQSYRDAIQPIVEAEQGYFRAIIEINPAHALIFHILRENSKQAREREISYLFPK